MLTYRDRKLFFNSCQDFFFQIQTQSRIDCGIFFSFLVLQEKRSNLKNLRHNKQRDRESLAETIKLWVNRGANPSNLRFNLGRGHKHLQGGKNWAERLQDVGPLSHL